MVGGGGVEVRVGGTVGVRVAVGGAGEVGVAVGGTPPQPANLKLPTRVRQLKLPVVA